MAEAALSKGMDFSCGAVLLSSPTPYVLDDLDVASSKTSGAAENVAGAGGSAGDVLPPWRRWTVNFMEKTGITARMQQAIRSAGGKGISLSLSVSFPSLLSSAELMLHGSCLRCSYVSSYFSPPRKKMYRVSEEEKSAVFLSEKMFCIL